MVEDSDGFAPEDGEDEALDPDEVVLALADAEEAVGPDDDLADPDLDPDVAQLVGSTVVPWKAVMHGTTSSPDG
jgi:hypothetical protein